MAAGNLGERIAAFGAWRRELADAVRRYGQWLNDSGLAEPALQARIERLLERLREDRISIAFVAEFSRGKSELINSIFFAEYRCPRRPAPAARSPARSPAARPAPCRYLTARSDLQAGVGGSRGAERDCRGEPDQARDHDSFTLHGGLPCDPEIVVGRP